MQFVFVAVAVKRRLAIHVTESLHRYIDGPPLMGIRKNSNRVSATRPSVARMGVVLPFETRAAKRTIVRRAVTRELDATDAELALMAAVRNGHDRHGILVAARPFPEQCRDR